MRLATISAVLFFIGCGGDGKGPKLGYVTGKVTLDGEPLVGASVTIQPKDGPPSVGFVGKDGSYVMEYKVDKPGAPVGTNPIVVLKHVELPEFDIDGDPAKETKIRMEALKKTGIPEEWRNGTKTITVEPGSNTFNIEMTRKSAGG